MGYKILLADDDRDLLEMLGRYFEMKGYKILQAGNGTEAVRMSAEEPDLILLILICRGWMAWRYVERSEGRYPARFYF